MNETTTPAAHTPTIVTLFAVCDAEGGWGMTDGPARVTNAVAYHRNEAHADAAKGTYQIVRKVECVLIDGHSIPAMWAAPLVG